MKKYINSAVKNIRTMKSYEALKSNKLLRLFKDRYNAKQYSKAQENVHKYGLPLLVLMREAFEEFGHDFWLDYGTLLGAIREKDFIGHDKDLDIGSFDVPDEKKKELEAILFRKGFKKHKEYLLNGKIVEESYNYKGAHVDIFYYHWENADQVWCYFCDLGPNVQYENFPDYQLATGYINHKTVTRFTELMDYTFKGEVFKIPKNYHEYLTDNYLDTYMEVNKNWVNGSSPPNIEFLKDDVIVVKEFI